MLGADAGLNAGKDLAAVLQALELSESMLDRCRTQFGGMKCEEAKRLKHLCARAEDISCECLIRFWISRCLITSQGEEGGPFRK